MARLISFIFIFFIVGQSLFANDVKNRRWLKEYYRIKVGKRYNFFEEYLNDGFSSEEAFQIFSSRRYKSKEEKIEAEKIFDLLVKDKGILSKAIGKHGMTAYFLLKKWNKWLADKKFEEFNTPHLVFDKEGKSFFAKYIDNYFNLDKYQRGKFKDLGGTYETVVDKNGATALDYMLKNRSVYDIYVILLQDLKGKEEVRIIDKIFGFSSGKYEINRYIDFINDLNKNDTYLSPEIRKFLKIKNRIIFNEYRKTFSALSKEKIEVLNDFYSKENIDYDFIITSEKYNDDLEKGSNKKRAAKAYNSFFSNRDRKITFKSAFYNDDKIISKRLMCLNDKFQLINIIKATNLNVEKDKNVHDEEIEHLIYKGISYFNIIGKHSCDFVVDLDKNEDFKYPFSSLSNKGLRLTMPKSNDEFEKEKNVDALSLEVIYNNQTYHFFRSRKSKNIYIKLENSKETTSIYKYKYEYCSFYQNYDCVNPRIFNYGDYNADGKLDFFFNPGLEKGDTDYIFISNPTNDKYVKIELPYVGC